MQKYIRNKTIVVTGAAEGIGFHIARNYLKENAKVIIVLDINEEKGKEAVRELSSEFGAEKADFIKCDVVHDLEDTFQKLCDKYSKIDLLVNNAGIVDEGALKKCVDINLIATMQWSLKFSEHMRKDAQGNGGTIINVSSVLGYRIASFCPIAIATKSGIVGFTKSLGHKRNYDQRGVRVIVICPGFTRTSLTKNFTGSKDEAYLELSSASQWQSPEEVGDKAVEIFKKAESGSVWEVDGGVLREVN